MPRANVALEALQKDLQPDGYATTITFFWSKWDDQRQKVGS